MKILLNTQIRFLLYIILIGTTLFPIWSEIFKNGGEIIVVTLNLLFWFIWLPLFIFQIIYKKIKKENIISEKLLKEFTFLSQISGWVFIVGIVFFFHSTLVGSVHF